MAKCSTFNRRRASLPEACPGKSNQRRVEADENHKEHDETLQGTGNRAERADKTSGLPKMNSQIRCRIHGF